MHATTRLICLLVALLAISLSLASQDRAHELAGKASSQHPVSCPATALTLQQCHDKFPDGCSGSKKAPSYDAYLDFLKDQDPGPKEPSTKDLGGADFKMLESKTPSGLGSQDHAKFASEFAARGEGNIHTVIAYLYFVEDTSKGTPGKPATAETGNCKIPDPKAFDYHLGIGFDAGLAAAAAKHPKQGSAEFTKLEKDSVVAEMTPYTRHTNWTFARVSALQGQQIKVVGQLMADNIHFNAGDDCQVSGALPKCWRSTIWEIHPITQFYVCQAKSECTASSPDSDWKSLDLP